MAVVNDDKNKLNDTNANINSKDEYILTHNFEENVILLNTYIYAYLFKYFGKLYMYINSYKINDSYLFEFENIIKALYNNLNNVIIQSNTYKSCYTKLNKNDSNINKDNLKLKNDNENENDDICKFEHDHEREQKHRDIDINSVSIKTKEDDINDLFISDIDNRHICTLNNKYKKETYEIIKNIKNIYIEDALLLLNNNNKNITYGYNLVKIKIYICLKTCRIYIYSYDCFLMNKTDNIDTSTINASNVKINNNSNNVNTSNKTKCDEQKKTTLKITFNKNKLIKEEEKKHILNIIIKNIKLHSFNNKATYKDSIQLIYNKLFNLPGSTIDLFLYNPINNIDNFFFDIYEPNFYNCVIQKKNYISYKILYEQYKNIMIKSKIIKLNKQMIKYLLYDSIFLPSYVQKNTFKLEEEHMYSSFSSYSECSSDGGSSSGSGSGSSSSSISGSGSSGAGSSNTSRSNNNNKVENKLIQEPAQKCDINSKDIFINSSEKTDEMTEVNTTEHKNSNLVLSEVKQFTPEKNQTMKTDSCNKVSKESSGKIKKNKKQKIKELFNNKNFRNILENIKEKIEELDKSVFLRVNDKNLKKGSFINSCNFEVNSLYDGLLLLKSCTTVYKSLKENKNKNNYLFLSKYVNMNISSIFEVYVYNKNIIAISQKYLNYYFQFLNDANSIIETINNIKHFYEKNLQQSFFCNNYIFLIYIHTFKKKKNKKKIILINAKSWLYKNKHPVLTNQFLKNYIYTNYKGKLINDHNFSKIGIYKYNSTLDHDHNYDNLDEQTYTQTVGHGHIDSYEKYYPNENLFDLYFYNDILYYCIVKDDSIYQKNNNIFPKDLHYIKEGEIDIDSLIETMKKEDNIQVGGF
ncbi:regulator of initiation factor 2 (eIF2) [Hepatocystis sp. ex Piliocolobus tephrosceles]|nr:regulator of initiation factor 2 (eIF2) [Hepatocystis sp. ex Piliocolobus tephrosceles]